MNIYEYDTVTLFHLNVHASIGELEGKDEPVINNINEKSINGYFAQDNIVVYASPFGSFDILISPLFIALRI
jgi:hypothetical protein